MHNLCRNKAFLPGQSFHKTLGCKVNPVRLIIINPALKDSLSNYFRKM